MGLISRLFHSHKHTRGPLYPVQICTNHDVLDHVSTSYDFTDIPYITAPPTDAPRYLLVDGNKATAIQDILALNGILDHVRDVCSAFPAVQIAEDKLQFDPPNDPEADLSFCYLRTNVFTKTGKTAKYPITLHFSETGNRPYVYDSAHGYEVYRLPDKTFGTIDYFADGEVGKAEIICWKDRACYKLRCKTFENGLFSLNTVERGEETLYRYNDSIQIEPEPDSREVFPKPKPQPKTRIVTRYDEETVYRSLSDTEIHDIQTAIQSVFDCFKISSEILEYRILDPYTEFDISLPDGMRLKKLLSFRDEIDIRIPKKTIDMDPDFERGVVVIRVKHPSEQIIVERQEVVEDAAPVTDENEEPSKLFEAVNVVVETGMASTTLLQRKLNIGYAHAARLIDELEERKIVGPFEGSKPRKVLITKQQWAEMQT